jgi:hypothetical protein
MPSEIDRWSSSNRSKAADEWFGAQHPHADAGGRQRPGSVSGGMRPPRLMRSVGLGGEDEIRETGGPWLKEE